MTISSTLISDAIASAGAISVALIGIAYLLQKVFVSVKSTETGSSIISLMHTELKRMSDSNAKLMLELQNLQTEVIRLNKELYSLTNENQKLHDELSRLTNEMVKVRKLLPIPKES